MRTPKFFIDTADVSAVKSIWEKLDSDCNSSFLAGVTTNPNAMNRVNATSMKEFENITNNLCKTVSSIRNDSNGIVYVQYPCSNVTFDQLKKWYFTVREFTDGKTSVGLKIPPYLDILKRIGELDQANINVTGIADSSTALLCFSYPVKYVSIIPGRMEENGINADEQLAFVNRRGDHPTINQEVITGSMRTLDGLKRAVEQNTVPTIGTKVFDLIFADGVKNFLNLWNYTPNKIESIKFSPDINKTMINLSVSFFNQMDEAGKSLKENINV